MFLMIIMALSLSVVVYIFIEGFLTVAFSKTLKLAKRVEDVENLEKIDDDGNYSQTALTKRLLGNMMNNLFDIVSMIIPKSLVATENATEQLRQAGMNVTPQVYAARVLVTTICFGITGLLVAFLLDQSISGVLVAGIFGLAAGIILSRFSLKRKIKKRKEAIYHQLPEVMDLLSVSVASGLGFDQALDYVVEKSEGVLIQEFDITRREMALGRPRREALTALGERCDNLEIKTFTTAVLQADEMGASLQNILHVQADTIRMTHKQNVEEQAQKLAVKILLPLVFFILPVVLIVILGPAVVQLITGF